MEEITLTDDTQKETISSIDEMLQGYESINVDTPTGDSSHEPENRPEIDLGIEDKTDPRLYYQSGKKKGQRRPQRGIKRKSGSEEDNATIGGEILSGALFLTLVDLLLPLAICGVNNYFSPNKIDANKLRLTKTQQNELAPLCDAVVKQWELTANPVALLGISLMGIYGMNFFMLKNAE